MSTTGKKCCQKKEEIDHGLEPPKVMCLELVWIERRKAFQARRGTGVKIDILYLGTQMKSTDTCLRKKKDKERFNKYKCCQSRVRNSRKIHV